MFVYSLWNIINGRSLRSVHLGNKTGLCASNLGTSWIHSLLVFCNFEINKYKEYVNFHERDKATFANILLLKFLKHLLKILKQFIFQY